VTTQTDQAAGISAMPRVNLMPPEIGEAERFRRLQLAMGCAVLASAVVVGGLYMHGKSSVTDAQKQVAAAQLQQTTLQAKLNSLASVKATFAAVQARQQMLQQAMGQEIRWSYMLNDLSFRIPSSVWLTGMQASENLTGIGTSTAPAASTLPGAPVSNIGSVSFSGVGMKHDDVATWLDALAKERGYSQPTFSSSTEVAIGTTSVVDWNTSVTLNANAYSKRYIQKAGS
jgi:Tfp pilus assembly protein PilN